MFATEIQLESNPRLVYKTSKLPFDVHIPAALSIPKCRPHIPYLLPFHQIHDPASRDVQTTPFDQPKT